MIPEKPREADWLVGEGLPEKIWIGKKDGEWPLVAFATSGQAKQWQAEPDSRVRRIWELSPMAIATERIVRIPEPTDLMWRDES